MICFKRNKFEAIPGCAGGLTEGSNSDYCILADAASAATAADAGVGSLGGVEIECLGPEPAQLDATPKIRLGLCQGD